MRAGRAPRLWQAKLLSLCAFPAVFLSSCRFEDRFIYYPQAAIEQTPARAGLGFEDVYFATEDGLRLHGWFVPHPGAKTTVVWFHGNAGNIGHRVDNLKLLHDKVGVHIFIFDYRGYGRSEGKPSEEGLYKDAAAAVAYLGSRRDVDPARLVFFGRSLGAAVAAEAALKYGCLALILETPFASIREMARAAFPLLPLWPLIRTRYDTLEKVRRIDVPVLVIHGDQDEIVPFRQGKEIFDAAPEPKEFYAIPGARHNDTYIVGGDAYFAAIKRFIERAGSARASTSARR
ncbi:MAG TPA: alpha/beta hydrolase [Candidatus Acidoferrales bacterium]|nr:alpha/beta hydrolase [Candidatus Acidoferrales bacterium]